jgi:3-oxoacyl-[acyl-carrier protein] reductase
MDLGIRGRACLVTGASQGIGRGIARVLAAEGCRVAILARRAALLEALADEIAARGGERPVVIAADLLHEGVAESVAAQVQQAFGGLDILVNNAGGSAPVALDAPDSAWADGMALNFEMQRRLTMPFIPGMRARGWGRIVNITGSSEPRGLNAAIAAKAAVLGWAKGLSCEVARDGITVNCVAPGRIHSEQILTRLHPDPAERQRFAEANIPVGHFGEPEDVAWLVAFLASPRGRHITGELIHVDGGLRRFAF